MEEKEITVEIPVYSTETKDDKKSEIIQDIVMNAIAIFVVLITIIGYILFGSEIRKIQFTTKEIYGTLNGYSVSNAMRSFDKENYTGNITLEIQTAPGRIEEIHYQGSTKPLKVGSRYKITSTVNNFDVLAGKTIKIEKIGE